MQLWGANQGRKRINLTLLYHVRGRFHVTSLMPRFLRWFPSSIFLGKVRIFAHTVNECVAWYDAWDRKRELGESQSEKVKKHRERHVGRSWVWPSLENNADSFRSRLVSIPVYRCWWLHYTTFAACDVSRSKVVRKLKTSECKENA